MLTAYQDFPRLVRLLQDFPQPACHAHWCSISFSLFLQIKKKWHLAMYPMDSLFQTSQWDMLDYIAQYIPVHLPLNPDVRYIEPAIFPIPNNHRSIVPSIFPIEKKHMFSIWKQQFHALPACVCTSWLTVATCGILGKDLWVFQGKTRMNHLRFYGFMIVLW